MAADSGKAPLDVESPSGAAKESARHGSHLSGSVSRFILILEWFGKEAEAATATGARRRPSAK